MSPSLVSESLMAEMAPSGVEVAMKGKVIEGVVAVAPPDFIYRSKLPDIDIPNHMALADYCLERAAQWAEKVCLIDGNTGRQLRYGEVELSMRRVAAGLANLGVPQGGVIALCLPNCAEFVQVFLGAAKRGAIVTTANPFYTAAELEKQITASGATMVITLSSYIEKLSSLKVQVQYPNANTLLLFFRDTCCTGDLPLPTRRLVGLKPPTHLCRCPSSLPNDPRPTTTTIHRPKKDDQHTDPDVGELTLPWTYSAQRLPPADVQSSSSGQRRGAAAATGRGFNPTSLRVGRGEVPGAAF